MNCKLELELELLQCPASAAEKRISNIKLFLVVGRMEANPPAAAAVAADDVNRNTKYEMRNAHTQRGTTRNYF